MNHIEKKFIAWSPKFKKLITSNTEGNYSLKIYFNEATVWQQEICDSNPTILQYVGGVDINNNEIYEGHVIELIKTKQKYYVKNVIEYHLWAYRNCINADICCKIVGHVYDDKKLMKQYARD